MNPSESFTSQNIRKAIKSLMTNGQNITAWAVQEHLGGGDFSEIEQAVRQHEEEVNKKVESSTEENNLNNIDTPSEQLLTENIIERNVPENIESSMSDMQNALGDLANKIWAEAASKAEDKVREKLYSVQKAHDEVKAAYVETQHANIEMQNTLSQLNDNLEILEKNYQESQTQLAQDQQELLKTKQQRDTLIKSVEELEEDNKALEQTAFDAKLEIAKSEGLAETIKEQLSLVKESEKQLQAALDRSDKKVDELNIELHDVSKTLKDEVRNRLAAERQLKQQEQLNQAPNPSPEQYPPQELPTPRKNDSVTPLKKDLNEAIHTDDIKQNIADKQSTVSDNISMPRSESTKENLSQPETKKARTEEVPKPARKKTRSLSQKLFDKKRNSKNKSQP